MSTHVSVHQVTHVTVGKAERQEGTGTWVAHIMIHIGRDEYTEIVLFADSEAAWEYYQMIELYIKRALICVGLTSAGFLLFAAACGIVAYAVVLVTIALDVLL